MTILVTGGSGSIGAHTALALADLGEEDRRVLEAAGDVIRPEPGELLWDAGDAYDLGARVRSRAG